MKKIIRSAACILPMILMCGCEDEFNEAVNTGLDILDQGDQIAHKANQGLSVILIIGILIAVLIGALIIKTIVNIIRGPADKKTDESSDKTGKNTVSPAAPPPSAHARTNASRPSVQNTPERLTPQDSTEKLAPQPMRPEAKPIIISYAEQHGGSSVHIHKGSDVVIGRDPSKCSVLYNDGTSGVSGIHCSIGYDFDRDEFIVTDLGSTYGTYIMPEAKKLEKGKPYRVGKGQLLSIGDPQNTIKLDLE